MIRLFSIRNGAAGTRQTLEAMAVLARNGSTLPFTKMVAGQYRPTEYENAMRKYWRYAEEMDETLTTVDVQAQTMMESQMMIGDCDDAAIVAAAVALAGGVPVRFVALRRPQDADFSHVLAEVAAVQSTKSTHWLRIDPTAPLDAVYDGWERMVQDI